MPAELNLASPSSAQLSSVREMLVETVTRMQVWDRCSIKVSSVYSQYLARAWAPSPGGSATCRFARRKDPQGQRVELLLVGGLRASCVAARDLHHEQASCIMTGGNGHQCDDGSSAINKSIGAIGVLQRVLN